MSTAPRPVLLAVYDTLADWEYGLATAHINSGAHQIDPGRFTVVTVGLTDAPIRTMGGMRVVPDITIDEVDDTTTAALILPGAEAFSAGYGAPWADLAERLLAVGIPVAAICGATSALARHGLLDHRPHTSNAVEYLGAQPGYRGGEFYVDELAVTDGDLITASGIAPAHFARAVLERLGLYRPETLAAWFDLYENHDPAAYPRLMAESA
ncbi:DJ-1/PfpI family protein [Williamsia herbipolensis]|uniref:DJ-1/PfpI family protein n=1 Tax=Williamsia herbipolensis TaxID=1603258 RepID=UPI0005F77A7F|nr:DJ-1/PfpI family protein [Williamsia herbipolensis]